MAPTSPATFDILRGDILADPPSDLSDCSSSKQVFQPQRGFDMTGDPHPISISKKLIRYRYEAFAFIFLSGCADIWLFGVNEGRVIIALIFMGLLFLTQHMGKLFCRIDGAVEEQHQEDRVWHSAGRRELELLKVLEPTPRILPRASRSIL